MKLAEKDDDDEEEDDNDDEWKRQYWNRPVQVITDEFIAAQQWSCDVELSADWSAVLKMKLQRMKIQELERLKVE